MLCVVVSLVDGFPLLGGPVFCLLLTVYNFGFVVIVSCLLYVIHVYFGFSFSIGFISN